MTGVGKPRVLLTMPVYDQLCPYAARAFWEHEYAANPRSVDIVERFQGFGSFLPGSFNECWKRALDLRDAGKVTHFAMQHSDVEPDSWWISSMLSDLIIRNAHAMFGVVALKDPSRTLTSTAIGNVDDSWVAPRKLSLAECCEFPVVFGPQHVCRYEEVLLCNTGLWVADLSADFWTDFSFDTHSRIGFDVSGNRQVQWRTEDWEMSRFLHDQGARYYATTRVDVRHRGVDAWSNRIK